MTHDTRCGAALLLVVSLVLAGLLLAHGLLVLAGSEVAASRLSERIVRIERLAERAALLVVDSAFADGVAASPDSLFGRDGRARWDGRLEALSDEVWLAVGRAREEGATRTRGLAVWRLDPASRVRSLGAALVTSGTSTVVGSSRIEAEGPSPVSGGDAGPACPPGGPPPPLAALRVDPDSSALALGRIGWSDLLAAAEILVSGAGSPRPAVHSGRCTEEPWNWGDPGPSAGPCASRFVRVHALAGATLHDGSGQGVLVSSGDLELVDTELHGLLLVEGRLRLTGRSRIVGLVHARAGAEVGAEASITGSACRAAAALGGGPFGRPIPVRPVRWIRLDG